ncbi:protein SPA1-RELATED 2 [Sesamum angolense]|uniref:Protein SPA1-RELATED 2 n=1 Tax=Sesamum angolense TaxID=2727404 RepID=A0AAE1WWB6_9LAMI|nr:protein SPA1-RELATED 2 [Sesamum angolense]
MGIKSGFCYCNTRSGCGRKWHSGLSSLGWFYIFSCSSFILSIVQIGYNEESVGIDFYITSSGGQIPTDLCLTGLECSMFSSLDGMDEAIGDEVAELVDDRHIRNKENEFSLKPGSSSMLQSNEMITPGVNDYPENSKHGYPDILEAKDLDRIGSFRTCKCQSSLNRERVQAKRNQWQNLYQIAGVSGIGNLHGPAGYKGKGQATSSAREDRSKNLFSGLLDQSDPPTNYNHNAVMDNLLSNDDKGTSGDILYSSGGIRTKILSKSGFSEYFIKSTLRGKGVIHKSQACRGSDTESGDLDHPKSGIGGSTNSAALLGLTAKSVSPISDGVSHPWNTLSTGDGITLREWLEAGGKKANKAEKMLIFRQVLNLVDFSHSHGVSLQDLRPSCFKLSRLYQVMYLGSSVRSGLTQDVTDQDTYQSNHKRHEKKPMHQSMLPLDNHAGKKRKSDENMTFIQRWPQFPSRSGIRSAPMNVVKVDGADPSNDAGDEHNPKTELKNQSKLFSRNVPNSSHTSQTSVSCMLEEKWYTSPELFKEKGCTFASNIYCLGVLLFELLGSFDSGRSLAAAMLDLRHRILPPSFLSENPKEAGFCLWLLILNLHYAQAPDDEESELLLYFLTLLDEQKQKDVSNLVEQIQCIEADIQEVEKRRKKKSVVLFSLPQESLTGSGSKSHRGSASLDTLSKMAPLSSTETRLMSSIGQLEHAYFSMRSNIKLSDSDFATQRDVELLKSRENWSTMGMEDKSDSADRLGGFFDGLCKYARYSKYKVRGILRNGEFSNSGNVICSLSFDRDEDYLAAGGVSKKIKIFEFQSLFNDSVDIHYPVVEMSNKSKLSCICWNSYIRNYLASTDYDGIVKLWDAATGQEFCHFIEHSERAWSVDFSRVDPMKIASGSDDRLVKLWSINEKNSLCTIRNNANVCCVQFSAYSTHLLSFSSADYKTYCYDLRNVSTPWCILAGHEKANFVGLSVADGYITCGSETNEVFAYYKSLPMPITAHKFGSIDPITGKETEDDNGQFVSSVCWRQKSNMVVAANSSGCIKLLQMV